MAAPTTGDAVATTPGATASAEATVIFADEVVIGAAPDASSAEPLEPPPVPGPAPEPSTELVNVPFDIGLVPGLSINGHYAGKRVRNTVSLAGVWNHAAVVEGITASFGVTVVDERSRGIAWGFVGNVNRGDHDGVQLAWGFNAAKRLRGVQWAGFNWAGEAQGAQIGLVNVGGRVRGLQIGLINIADEADASFGLIPVTRKGGIHPELWTSDTSLIAIGLRFPAKYTYAFVSGGIHPLVNRPRGEDTDDEDADEAAREDEGGGRRDRDAPRSRSGQGWELGAGFGGHIPIGDSAFIDIDLGTYAVAGGLAARPNVAVMERARLLAGFSVDERLTFFAGPTFNVIFDAVDRPVERVGYGWVTARHSGEHVRVRAWPGFAAGVRF